MKITKVEISQVDIQENVFNQWRPIVCRVFTDEGMYGDGEAALAYGVGSPAAFGMIKDLSKLIIGMDPLANEVIWDKLYKATFWGQNGGPVVFAGISAIDIALWDIKGKFFNAPVWKLLGGKFRDSLRAYASQLQLGWDNEPPYKMAAKPAQYAEAAKKAVAEGYDAIKIDFFNTYEDGTPIARNDQISLQRPEMVNLVERRVAAVREAIGPDVDIIMENHSLIDANVSVQFARAVEKYNIFYYEECATPYPKVVKYIADNINIPISHGERIYSRWQYAQYFEDMSVRVIQPDIGNMGGLTEAKKVCDMAYVYDVSVQAHVCASPFSTSVSLHLEAAIPNFQIHEHHICMLKSWNDKLAKLNPQPKNGYVAVPDAPGIGNELSDFCFESSLMKAVVE